MTRRPIRRNDGANDGAMSLAKRAGAALAVGLACLASTPVASAQFGGGGQGGGPGGGMFGPPVSNRDLDLYSEVLNLTADQKEAAKALLQGYQESYQQQAQEMRDRMDAARQSGGGGNNDPAQWDKVRKGMDELRDSRKKAEESFQGDLKAVLTPAQIELWPKAEREVRRERTLGRGMLSGERVDVIQIAQDVTDPLSEADRKAALDALAPTLEQYAVDLDRELVARNQAVEDGMSKAGDLMAKGDDAAMQALFDKGKDASDRVREVNQRYARQVEALLPDAQRPEFEAAVKKASFPEVYRDSYGKKVLDAAVGFKDLDDNQRASVQAISDGFSRDLAAADEKMTAAILDREKTMTVRDMFRGRGGGQGGRRAGMEDLYQARRDLEESTLESLKKVLTPEQAAKLPERERPGSRNGAAGGRGDQTDNSGANSGAARPRRRTF